MIDIFNIFNIKTLLGLENDTSQDALINLLILQATEEAKEYTHQDSIDGLMHCIEQMVIYNFHRIDNKELNSENYSGVSFNYINDYPPSILRELKANRKVRFI